MNGSDNDVVLGKHLESLANAAKQYTLAELALFEMAADNTLDTVPASVNGGLWYELDSNAPVVKIFHGGKSYSLADNLTFDDSTLTVDSGFNSALDVVFGLPQSSSVDSGFNTALNGIFPAQEDEDLGFNTALNVIFPAQEAVDRDVRLALHSVFALPQSSSVDSGFQEALDYTFALPSASSVDSGFEEALRSIFETEE